MIAADTCRRSHERAGRARRRGARDERPGAAAAGGQASGEAPRGATEASGRHGMRTRAAVLRDMGKDWEVIELDLDPPKEGEVLIRFAAAGLCHSDDHLRTGDIPVRYPIVGGHEGAGVVEEVGTGVSRLSPGEHVVHSL